MKVALLNFENVVMSSVTGPYDILTQTNEFINQFEPKNSANFEVKILNTSGSKSSALSISQDTITNKDVKFDLVIIPAMDYSSIQKVLQNEKKAVGWIKKQHEMGAEIASICLGAFILASTGLLDNKMATTHWMGQPLFKEMFPKVDLVDDKIITDQVGIYTSGGAFSFTSLMIYLIEKYVNRDIALIASRIFLIHLHDTVQQAYSIFNLQKEHTDKEIKRIQNIIELKFEENITVENLAKKANMSNRNFIRRFKKAVGNSPLEYIQRVRIEAAKKLLVANENSVEQACLSVGYEDISAFRKIFKRFTGITPSEYRKKYRLLSQPEFVGLYAS